MQGEGGVAAEGEIRSLWAYLPSMVTRLPINRLRRQKTRREQYAGPWLPEPLVGDAEAVGRTVLDGSPSMAFLMPLEGPVPVERAVFLLREVFGYGYAEVASIVGKGEAERLRIPPCARRARPHLRGGQGGLDPIGRGSRDTGRACSPSGPRERALRLRRLLRGRTPPGRRHRGRGGREDASIRMVVNPEKPTGVSSLPIPEVQR